jgi:hypothetical protein
LLGLAGSALGCGTGEGTSARKADSGTDGRVSGSVDAGLEAAADASESPPSSVADASSDGDGAVSCSALPEGGTLPASAVDVSYSWMGPKAACFGEPFCQAGCAAAFLQGLLDCDMVEGGYFWNFGSVYIRVAGRRGNSCVYDIGSEIEGAVTYQECTASLPVAPWPGLRNVNGNSQTSIFEGLNGCVSMGSCSVLSGYGTPCDEGAAAVPTCPSSPGHC